MPNVICVAHEYWHVWHVARVEAARGKEPGSRSASRRLAGMYEGGKEGTAWQKWTLPSLPNRKGIASDALGCFSTVQITEFMSCSDSVTQVISSVVFHLISGLFNA
jgi:hypothetical protein